MATSRKTWLLLALPLLLAVIVTAGRFAGSDPAPATAPATTRVISGCEDLNAAPLLDRSLLRRLSSPVWMSLAGGRPDLYLSRYRDLPSPGPLDEAGRARAWLELSATLLKAQDVALSAQRVYLEQRLAIGLPDLPGRELIPFLRASVALQAGEKADVSSWLDQVPVDSPLQPAVRVLAAMAREPISGERPRLDAIQRWRRHARAYAAALEKVGCPFPGAGPRRAALLASWSGGETLPDPAGWARALAVEEPDFVIGACGERDPLFQIDLFDPSLYTLLAGLALEQAERHRMAGPVADFHRLELMASLDPERTRIEACALADRWDDAGVDPLAPAFSTWGDQGSPAEMAAALRARCEGRPLATCPRDSDAVRAMLEQELEAAEGCYQAMAGIDADVGAFAGAHQLFGGVVRRRVLSAVLEGRCEPIPATQAYRLVQGQVHAGSPWVDPVTRLSWAGLEIELGQLEAAPRELDLLKQDQPLFTPLAAMVIKAEKMMERLVDRSRPSQDSPELLR